MGPYLATPGLQANIDRVAAAWSGPASPDAIARRTEWRDRRLAALKAHKNTQPDA